MTDKNECIICMESDNLIKNINCTCKYFYHINCYRKYGKSKCLLCNKNITTFMYILNPIVNSTNTNSPTTPITPTIIQIQIQQQTNQNTIEQNDNCTYVSIILCLIILLLIIIVLHVISNW